MFLATPAQNLRAFGLDFLEFVAIAIAAALEADTWHLWMCLFYLCNVMVMAFLLDSFLATLTCFSFPRVFKSIERPGAKIVNVVMLSDAGSRRTLGNNKDASADEGDQPEGGRDGNSVGIAPGAEEFNGQFGHTSFVPSGSRPTTSFSSRLLAMMHGSRADHDRDEAA